MDTLRSTRIALALLLSIVPAALSALARASTLDTCLVSSVVTSDTTSPAGPHRFELVRSGSGQVILRDRSDSGTARSTPLGVVVAQGIVRGAIAVGPDGVAWLALSGDGLAVDLLRIGDVSQPGPLAVEAVDSIAVGPAFDPDSIRVGIIAVLIGLAKEPEPVPLLSLRDGTSNTFAVWNGRSLRLLLPHIEQQS